MGFTFWTYFINYDISVCNSKSIHFQEIGVDLEAHSYRSFQGIACLIQISSPVKDYIIDPFPLWSDLTLLNEIFANPKILKIFHGAKNDIQWLQRDFSIYVRAPHMFSRILLFLIYQKNSQYFFFSTFL